MRRQNTLQDTGVTCGTDDPSDRHHSPYIHPAAAEDDDADPRTPHPDLNEHFEHDFEDRRRLGDLENEVGKYRGLLEEVNLHIGSATGCPR